MAARNPDAYSRYYRTAWRNDFDFQEFCNTAFKRTLYIELMNHDSKGNSGIHLVNPEILAAETMIPLHYVKIFLGTPNNLFAFHTSKNVIWLKKFFLYSQKVPGQPSAFMKSILNDYEATRFCEHFWRGFFEANQEILNKFYLEKFYDDFQLLEAGEVLTETKKQGLIAIQDLFHIKQSLFKEKPRKEISFTVDLLMTV